MLRDCRVFVTSHRVIAFAAGAQIERVFDAELAVPFSIPASRGSLSPAERLDAQLTDGSTVWINRGGGCGCASPLLALTPPVDWHGVQAEVVPG